MTQAHSSHSVASLRAITYRVTSTPTKALPQVVAQIAGQIWNSRDILSLEAQTSKFSADANNVVHRFKTTIASLLQDRTIEGRWSAVVLTKATIEAGGLATLSKANVWVKALIGILKKPDPPTTRQLAAICLTRIFMLTWDHSNLVREITTPALPAFISACLTNADRARCSAGELEAVLEAFETLIARHPTVFRTHESQIRALTCKILSSNSTTHQSDQSFSQSHRLSAALLLVLLNHCAPKQGAADAWDGTWKSAINAAHATCDQLFRSIVEDAQSDGSGYGSSQKVKDPSKEVGTTADDALGLHQWHGIFEGSQRLITLIDVLRAHIGTSFGHPLTVRIGLLMRLVARIMSLTLESASDSDKVKPQIPKDEREALYCVLPDIHIATLGLVDALLVRLKSAAAPIIQTLLDSMLGVFAAEYTNMSIRSTTYATVSVVLDIAGPSLSRRDVAELGQLITSCCKDLLPDASITKDDSLPGAVQSDGINGFHARSTKDHADNHSHQTMIHETASSLLITLATKINPSCMPRKLRQQIERTAILARNKEALVACVLNPAVKPGSGKLEMSLLPILARQYPNAPEVEALLRPRMPPVRLGEVEDINGVDGYDREAESDIVGDDEGDSMTGFEQEPDGQVSSLSDNNGPVNGTSIIEKDHDDLYSLTPPRQAQPVVANNEPAEISVTGAAHVLSGTKRGADDAATETTLPSKRARASPPLIQTDDARSVQRDAAHIAPMTVEDDHPLLQADAHKLVEDLVIDDKSNKPVDKKRAVAQQDDFGSDDSDFELPPLTMEPDTDPEDDDNDERIEADDQ